MNTYAIVETGGKQYWVKEGDVIDVELLPTEAGKSISFDQVLMMSTGKEVKAGTPTVAGALVQAQVIGPVRGPKVVSYKYKQRKNYRRKVGHRQDYMRVKITGVKHGS